MINTIESINPEKILFCDYIIVWNNETKYRKSPSTYDGYVGIITKHLYPYFKAKGLRLIDVKLMHIEGYQRHILHDTSLSVNTLRKHHEVMRACLNYAYKNDFISKSPYTAFSLPRKVENEMSYYTEEQLVKLLRVAYGTQIESFIYLAVWFGLRKSEVLGLRWDNVDFDNKCLYICETRTRIKDYNSGHWVESQNVRMKTLKSKRAFPLSVEQLHYLSDLYTRQASLCSSIDYVCINFQGVPLHYDYVLHAFQKLLRENDLPKIRIHDLRHSNATLMLNSGFSMKQVSEWLGHSTYKLTADTYTHVSAENKLDMSNTIGHKLAPFEPDSVIRFDCVAKGCDLCYIYHKVCADCPCSDKCTNCVYCGSDVCKTCCLNF